MARKFFQASKPSVSLHAGTAGPLVTWLETYINILFPDHSIDRWSSNDYGDNPRLIPTDLLPKTGINATDIHHIVCYVRPGRSEGKIIEVGFYLRNSTLLSLTWLKAFGSLEECWNIASAISEALELIMLDQCMPELVDMAKQVTTKYSKCRESAITCGVTISTSINAITVTTGSGMVLDQRQWDGEVSAVKYSVGLRVKDWQVVLTNLKLQFAVVSNDQMMVDDLPGYVLSGRGRKESNGLYVLPPGGDPLNDRDYLGYFQSAEQAKVAARAHRDAQIAETV